MGKIFHDQLGGLQALNRGARVLSQAVSPTLGPPGNQIIIQKGKENPIVTRNGVTIAKEITLSDPFENLGVKILRDASIQAVDHVGDGATTTIILAEALFSAGLLGIASGYEPQEVKQGILYASKSVIQELEKLAVSASFLEDIFSIATTAANNDKSLGKTISDAVDKVGSKGLFIVSESLHLETSLEIISGMSLKAGYLSPYFVTRPETMDIFWEEAFVLVVDQKIDFLSSALVRFLDLVFQEKVFPLIIVARDFSKDVLNTLVVNKIKRNFPVCAVKIPETGEEGRALLEDLAIFSGASLIEGEFEGILDALGCVQKVSVKKDFSIFLHGGGLSEAKKSREEYLRSTIDKSKSHAEIHFLEKRLAGFSEGIAKINLGASSEAELKEKRNSVENALKATQIALKQGVVAGGGVALLRASEAVQIPEGLSSGTMFGFNCLLQAVLAPLKTIATNCGRVPEEVVRSILSQPDVNFGYNGFSDSFENLLTSGVCDPSGVTTASLKYAVSVSCLLLTSSFFVADSSVQLKNKLVDGPFFN